MASQTLKQGRLSRPDAQVMKLDLSLGPSERRGALIGGRVAMLVDAIQQGGARFGRHRPERDPNRGARRHDHAAAQGEDRIKHGADGIGQRSRVQHRKRRVDVAAPAEEARPVGFELGLPTASPSATLRCAAHISGSDGVRFRRVARIAPGSTKYSVSTNSFAKAG